MKMRSLAVAERIYLTGKLTTATDDLKRAIIDVYVSILEYEVRALSYFNQNLLKRFGRNAFKFDNWNAMIEKIKSYDNQCNTLIKLVDIEGHQDQSQQVQLLLKELDRKNDTLIHEALSLRKNDLEFQCLEVFRTMDYERYKNKNPSRIPGTCNWFLDHPKYQDWLKDTKAKLLWVSADPGCGKSVLAKTLVDEQFMSLSSTAADNVCYFFFKDDDQSSKQPTNAIASFLHQLFTQNHSLIKYALPSFQCNGSKLSTLFQEQWQILLSATADSGAGTTICIIDALDECEEKARSTFIQMLRDVSSARDPHPRLKILVTGRPSVFYGRLIPAENPGTEIRLTGENEEEKEKISQEIGLFIDAKAESFRMQRQQLGLNDDAHEIIRAKINTIENRTYLWLSLIFPELADNPGLSIARLRRKLDHIPETVDEAYDKILNRAKDRGKALRILQVVVAAARPLTLREMNMALALAEMDEIGEISLEPEITFQDTLKNSCGSFLDIKNSIIYLIHQTAKDFLLKRQVAAAESAGPDSWKASIDSEDANTSFAEICVSYLFLPQFESDIVMASAWCPSASEIEKHDLLGYAAKYWPHHLKESAAKASSSLMDNSIELCRAGSGRCNNWLGIYLFEHQIDLELARFTIDMEVIAVIGVKHLLEAYLQRGIDPLSMLQAIQPARFTERFDIIDILLKKGAQPHLTTAAGETYMNIAVTLGDFGLVKSLLNRGADPNEKQHRTSLLSRAAARGYHEIVQILLENGARRESRCELFGRTPLSYAAQGERGGMSNPPLGHAERCDYSKTLSILLHSGTDIYTRDDSDRTPLYYAIRYENTDGVRLLLDAGVNPHFDVCRECPALHVAAKSGNPAIIELLIKRGVFVDIRDRFGQTPLSYAAECSGEDEVKILLDNNADPNSKDGRGRTPLHYASRWGKEEVVRVLLDAGADPESMDRQGDTPLLDACSRGRTHIVKILLGRVKNLSSANHNGQTPLSVAEYSGHKDTVELLKEAIRNKTSKEPLESDTTSIVQSASASIITEIPQRQEGEGITVEDLSISASEAVLA